MTQCYSEKNDTKNAYLYAQKSLELIQSIEGIKKRETPASIALWIISVRSFSNSSEYKCVWVSVKIIGIKGAKILRC